MRKEINPFTNPLGYSLSRQEETNRLTAHFKVRIKEKRLQSKVIKFVERYRNEIVDPIYFIDSISFNNEDSLLSKLIKKSPIYLTAVSNWRKYLTYCEKLFSIAGLYSLEDDYIRLYFYTFNRDRELKKKLKEIFGRIFAKSRTEKISLPKKQREERIRKFLCYGLHKKKSLRSLGRQFKVNKDTIRHWIDEVEDWSDGEKYAVMSEGLSSKAIENKDIYGDAESLEKEFKKGDKKYIKTYRPKALKSEGDYDYGLTDEGLYNTGKTKMHKPSDKSEVD